MASSQPRRRSPPLVSKGRVFYAVIAIMLLAFVAMVVLSIFGNGSETQGRASELCVDVIKCGFAAVVTLLGTSAR